MTAEAQRRGTAREGVWKCGRLCKCLQLQLACADKEMDSVATTVPDGCVRESIIFHGNITAIRRADTVKYSLLDPAENAFQRSPHQSEA